MADIVIRGMEMPESCLECVLTNSFFRNLHCDELEGMSGFVGSLPHTNDRHPDCPLGTLPKGHGRLGDLDELMNRAKGCLDELTILSLEFLVNGSSTIVPAEGGENE